LKDSDIQKIRKKLEKINQIKEDKMKAKQDSTIYSGRPPSRNRRGIKMVDDVELRSGQGDHEFHDVADLEYAFSMRGS